MEQAVGQSDDNASPVWNFRCVREIENDKRERVERMGVIPAFDEDMKNLAAQYGKMGDDGRAYLSTLSQSSDEDSGSSVVVTAEAREFFDTLSDVCDRESALSDSSDDEIMLATIRARTTNPNSNPYSNPNPNPNPSPLNQPKGQDLTIVLPDMLSERQKRLKVCLMTIVVCNNMTNLKQQPRRRHRKRNKVLTQHQRDNGQKWMDGTICHFFNLIFIFTSLDVL